jgi:hypothetical protein
MKKLVLSLLAVGAMGLYSCVDDPCKDVDCVNGTCDGVTGACLCDAGYETGTDGVCNVEERTKFLGAYTISGTITCGVTGNGTLDAGTPMTIATSAAGVDRIAITLAGVLVLNATVDGNAFTITSQTVGGYTYTGQGTISGNNITFTINEDDPSIPEVCVYAVSGSKS